MRDKMCNECKRCDGDLCNYFDNYSDRESTLACILFEPKKPTVFDHITESAETLAEKFVYFDCDACDDNGIGYPWCSTLFADGGHFETEDKAIAATIKELKKEVNNE